MGRDADGGWDGICACGKVEMDGVRCKLGATHRRLGGDTVPEIIHPQAESRKPVKRSAVVAKIKGGPDLAGRRIIVAAYCYYVLDDPVMTDAEYDKLSQYVADNWDALDPDRQWALGNPDSTRAGGSHIKFSRRAVSAALGREQPLAMPLDWKFDKTHGHYVTAVL